MIPRIRRKNGLVGAAIVLPLAVILSACQPWTTFGFNAAHTGYNSAETVINAANVGTLVEGGATEAVSGPISSAPTTADDILYATANVGSTGNTGTLYSYQADGSSNCTTPAPYICSPLNSVDVDGNHTLTSSPTVDIVDSTPSDNIIYVGAADGILRAYNTSLTQLWQSSPLGGSIKSSPVISNGYVFVTIEYGESYAFPLTNGTDGNNSTCAYQTGPRSIVCLPEWGDATPGDATSSPAVANGFLYSSAAGGNGTPAQVYAFGTSFDSHCTGTPYNANAFCHPLWTAAWDSVHYTSPAVANGLVYIGSGTSGLEAFSANGTTDCTGTAWVNLVCTPVWTGTTGRQNGSSPAIDTSAGSDGIVYIGARNGMLYAFDATTGSLLWSKPTGGTIDSAPAIADGVVYIGCSSSVAGQVCTHNFFAFDATSGTQLWTASPGGSVDSSPIVVDETPQNNVGAVYVGIGDQVFGYTLPS